MPSFPSPHLSSLSLSFSLLILLLLHSTSATTPPPSQLIDRVCKNTTNYTFCIQTLYSDSRAATADQFELADIAFRFAFHNATHTRDYIAQLLKNGPDSEMVSSLRSCEGYYDKAVTSLLEASSDLDSETYFNLGSLASDVDGDAKDCEATFKADQPNLLSPMNANLRAICNICVAVSKLFSISS